MAINAIGAHEMALKKLELMCADPNADLKAPVETDGEIACLEDARNRARALALSLPQLRGGKALSDRQAASLISSLTENSLTLEDLAEAYPGLEGAKEVKGLSSALIDYATGLEGLQESYSAGVAEGIRQGRIVKRRTP